MRRALLLAAVLATLAAAPAGAYQHFSEPTVAGGVEPERWQSLPIKLTVDNGPTDISGEIATAVATWNNVPLAQDPWGTLTKAVDGNGDPVDFTGANFGTAWGNLTGDGSQEVVFDEDGSGIRALGLDPAAVNGMGDRSEVIVNGNAAIDDMFLIVNGQRTNFDRQSTEVHELGHTLGLAHSSVGFSEGRDGALSPVLESQEPTMFPYSVPGDARRTLEADDVAALESLYPDNPSFISSTGTITGTVTRCGTGEPVLGANVRAINVASPAIQITGVTGFDGATDGSYEIQGVPPGEYDVVVEPLAGDPDYLDRLAMYSRVDTDFTAEYLNQTKEGDCAQDDDPNDKEPVQVGAAGTKTADFQVEGSSLALVIDRTGSMGPEIGAIKAGLETMIDGLVASGASLPKTAIVTFDDHATVDVVSRDPDRLRSAINAITLHSTPDCPEGSNAALMAAGRLLGSGGRAILVTDAESHPTGPSREAVDALYASKGARLSVLLSGSCPPPPASPRAARVVAAAAVSSSGGPNDPGPDEDRPVDVLGNENSVRTFSEESLFSGGLFSFEPQIKGGTAEANTRYSDTLANLGIAAVRPAVAAVDPPVLPQGTALAVELTGSDTGFRAGGTTVAVAGGGVSVTGTHVLSPTRLVLDLRVAADAPLGFRDVSVHTDRGDGSIETATGIGAVEVIGPPAGPTVLSVTPAVGAVGTTEDVTISGGLTHFVAGTSLADLGAGVIVNHLTVLSPTSAVANVTIQPGAAVGFRDARVLTGAENAGESVPGPFLVTAAPPAVPRLTGASPGSAARGSTVDVTLTGAGTAFAPGTSAASVSGTGVQVLSTTVTNATHAVARLRIAPGAPLGFRDLRVTTGAQHAALLDGFEVTPAPRAEPTPTPSATPTPTPARTTCTDTARPHAAFASGTHGLRAAHGRLALHGRASDDGCVADISVAGRVARVEVAIARTLHGGRCRFVGRDGRLTPARRCAKPVWLEAKGTARWSLTTKRRLARGAYTVRVRAVDAAGNVQARPVSRTARLR